MLSSRAVFGKKGAWRQEVNAGGQRVAFGASACGVLGILSALGLPFRLIPACCSWKMGFVPRSSKQQVGEISLDLDF